MSAADDRPRLEPCPASPNCVSSQAEDPTRRVEALPWPPGEDAAAELRRLLESLPRTRVVAFGERRLTAECRTALFGFADDLELLLDPLRRVVEVRSASRTGYWDFGVNRRRVERLRELIENSRR